jgi:hypothetical protein
MILVGKKSGSATILVRRRREASKEYSTSAANQAKVFRYIVQDCTLSLNYFYRMYSVFLCWSHRRTLLYCSEACQDSHQYPASLQFSWSS